MVQDAIRNTLILLSQTLKSIGDENYSQSIAVLSGATIGQHVRHVIELYQCLEEGKSTGAICYDNRKRDKELEASIEVATAHISRIVDSLGSHDTPLILVAEFGRSHGISTHISTTYFRELAYNLDHSIHHMALIKIGLLTIENVDLDPSFGVAPSTSRHKNSTET